MKLVVNYRIVSVELIGKFGCYDIYCVVENSATVNCLKNVADVPLR